VLIATPARAGHRLHPTLFPQPFRSHAASPLLIAAATAARSRFALTDRWP
jgi:hypothetical protein